ncbi:MAG TPA: hypothetical protein VFW09_16955 [Solirubrobacteraceae bacterium]|nr:hypothetical protein [Solirubrobacteraceae bacterium]
MAQRSRKRGRHGRPPDAPAAARPPDAPAAARQPAAPAPTRQPATPPIRTAQSPPAHLPQPSRSEARNAEVRAALRPIAAGERPRVIVAASAAAAALALANLIAWLAGDKIGGKHPAAGGIIVFSAVMAAAAIGMWRLWYGAVLGFMGLLAIIAVLFALLLVEASNLLGVVVALAVIVAAGYLFFKLVRVLSRLQMPRSPERRPE